MPKPSVRDPKHERAWLALVDGQEAQQREVEAAMERHRTDVAAIQDFVHVLESLWKAAYCFHAHGTPEAETWVLERAGPSPSSEHPAPALGSIRRGCARFSPNPFSCNSSDRPRTAPATTPSSVPRAGKGSPSDRNGAPATS